MVVIYSNNVTYNVYVIENRKMVVAVTKYNGNTVRAVAKCHPEDTFDEKTGIRLAVLRCEIKLNKMKRSILKEHLQMIVRSLKIYEKAIRAEEKRYDKKIDEYMVLCDDILEAEKLVQDILEAKDVGNE